MLENLKAQMDRVRYLSMPNATPIETLIGQHTAIIEAIGRRSPEGAEAAMHTHLGEISRPCPGWRRASGAVRRLRLQPFPITASPLATPWMLIVPSKSGTS